MANPKTKLKTKGKRGPGQPPHKPTDEQRGQVNLLVTAGIQEDLIASIIGIAPKTLRKHYAREIQLGATLANAKVAGALYNKAIGGDTTAMIFWTKTRMGWKETTAHEHSGPDGGAIPYDLNSELDRIAARLKADGISEEPAGDGEG